MKQQCDCDTCKTHREQLLESSVPTRGKESEASSRLFVTPKQAGEALVELGATGTRAEARVKAVVEFYRDGLLVPSAPAPEPWTRAGLIETFDAALPAPWGSSVRKEHAAALADIALSRQLREVNYVAAAVELVRVIERNKDPESKERAVDGARAIIDAARKA